MFIAGKLEFSPRVRGIEKGYASKLNEKARYHIQDTGKSESLFTKALVKYTRAGAGWSSFAVAEVVLEGLPLDKDTVTVDTHRAERPTFPGFKAREREKEREQRARALTYLELIYDCTCGNPSGSSYCRTLNGRSIVPVDKL